MVKENGKNTCFVLAKLKLLSLFIFLKIKKIELFLPEKKKTNRSTKERITEELNTTAKNIILYIFIAKQVFLTMILSFTKMCYT